MTLLEKVIARTVALPRPAKKSIVMGLDAFLCILTVSLAFYLRIGERAVLPGYQWPAAAIAPALALPIFVLAGLYRSVFRYVGWEALAALARAILVYGLIYAGIFTVVGVPGVPRSIGLIQPILLFIALGSSRAFARYWLGGRYRRRGGSQSNALIYGAGSAGRQLAVALSEGLTTRVVAFVDDDHHLHNSLVAGIRVSAPDKLPDLVERHAVSEIFLAIPSAARWRRNEILKMIQSVGVAVRTLPGLLDLAHGRVTVSDLRPLEVDDLLGREPVAPDLDLLERDVRGRVVLVTGAGGSIGSELCRQILALRPSTLLLVDSSEYALYSIHRDLERIEAAAEDEGSELVPLLGSICDEARMRAIFRAWRPHIVYHAAAYKHVPLVEHNPIEGIRNNVFGTLVAAQTAQEFGAGRFVLISTDKAVRPTNIMGTSKRIAEMVLQAFAAEQAGTCFSMVRFGNVLGSSGSVVPLFRQQVAAGGPVTVTDPEVTRYFMTIPEAAQLVLHAGAMAQGGEVFVLDMGEPVRILDLAVRIIELSGFKARHAAEPNGEIEIVFSGLRPGEKLYEELLIGNNPAATSHPRIMMASENFIPLPALRQQLEQLAAELEGRDVAAVRDLILRLVPEYEAADTLVDWVHLESARRRPANARSRATQTAGGVVP
jgi:FlaA1/EpsC-like NDP-sugar epimerase